MSIPSKVPIKERVSLKPWNTLGIDVTAGHWVEVFHPDDFTMLMETDIYQKHPHYVLGGGSNVLFPGDYHGLIIKNSIPGIDVLSEDEQYVVIQSGAGVVWDDLVRHCLNNKWGGIENLSMIPGLTGAAPIQNIGAYGVEIKETFLSLDAIHLESGRTETFDRDQCRFGYRDSIFKQELKGRYFITGITLRLDKNPRVNISYGPLKTLLAENGIQNPTIHDVSLAVRQIRSSKLPDPAVTGNAGSFFKNPVVSTHRFEMFQDHHPEIPGYPVERSGYVKIPAAWLIETCGFKGLREGDAGVHERHALILVNHGRATGRQLLNLAQKIRDAVQNEFNIILEPEVNIVNGGI